MNLGKVALLVALRDGHIDSEEENTFIGFKVIISQGIYYLLVDELAKIMYA